MKAALITFFSVLGLAGYAAYILRSVRRNKTRKAIQMLVAESIAETQLQPSFHLIIPPDVRTFSVSLPDDADVDSFKGSLDKKLSALKGRPIFTIAQITISLQNVPDGVLVLKGSGGETHVVCRAI